METVLHSDNKELSFYLQGQKYLYLWWQKVQGDIYGSLKWKIMKLSKNKNIDSPFS